MAGTRSDGFPSSVNLIEGDTDCRKPVGPVFPFLIKTALTRLQLWDRLLVTAPGDPVFSSLNEAKAALDFEKRECMDATFWFSHVTS